MKRHFHLLPACALAGSVPLAFAPSPQGALAQAIEEVVVTARQREELLSDVPAAITAFTSTDIARAGIKRAEDFVALTPGVSLVNTAEVGDTQVSIRGINGARDAEANFAFIVDGILYTNPSAFNREFSNLRQIEVLKGPQGALYGRNASAGAIIVTTRKPGNEFEGEIRAQGGSQDTVVTSGYAGGALIQDQLYGSVAFDYRNSNGFRTNSFTGDSDTVDQFENWNANGRLIWEPTEQLSVDTKFRYGKVDAGAIVFNASFFLDANGGLGTPPGQRGSFEQDPNDHEFRFTNNVDSENEQETTEFSIKFDYEMDWATATGWFLYSDIEQFFFADGTSGDFGYFTGTGGVVDTQAETECQSSVAAVNGSGFQLNPPATFNNGLGGAPGLPGAAPGGATVFGPYGPTTCDGTQFQRRDQQDYSFELRLTSNPDQRLRWATGFYFLDLEREVGVNLLPDINGEARPKALFVPGQTESLFHDRFDTRVYAVFGNINYDVTDDVEFSAALRWDREQREVSSLVPPPTVAGATTNFVDLDPTVALPFSGPFNGGSPLNPAYNLYGPAGNVIGSRSSIPDREEVFTQVQPKVSLTWDVTPDHTVYTSWGIGFKSGGFNNLGTSELIENFFNDLFITTPDPGVLVPKPVGAPLQVGDVFDKEVSRSIEIGFKSSVLDGRLEVEGALYRTDVDDMQFFEFFVGSFGLLRAVTNIDDVRIYGGELAGTLAVTDELTLFGGLGVVEGEILENRNRPDSVGNEVPYAPKLTANWGAEYVTPINGLIDFVGRFDYSYIGKTRFHTLQEGNIVPNVFNGVAFGGGIFPASDMQYGTRDAFSLVNVRAGVEGEQWGVSAFVNNLMDKEFLNEIIPAPEFGGSFVSPGTRRAWGVEAYYRF